MKPLAVIIVAYGIALTVTAPGRTEKPGYAKLIVGQWQGPRHVRAFYGSGEFTLDPEPEGRPLGSWKILGDMLTIRYPGDHSETTERILKLTPTEMVIEADGRKSTYTRIVHW